MQEHKFTFPICLTHQCNLNCVYCFQVHNSRHEMTIETGKECIDWIFEKYLYNPVNKGEITFFGGEPLLRFDIMKKMYEYTHHKYHTNNFHFFASTNGTLLTDEMKGWFTARKKSFCLGLSLDGTPSTHNQNRSNSFNMIDVTFFKETWPSQNVKMTISKKSIFTYAEDVKFIHSLGFGINGADLCVGTQNWNGLNYARILAPQLLELVNYYEENPHLYNALFQNDIALCAIFPRVKRKSCGCGEMITYFDTDGKQYPCTYMTPMTFNEKSLNEILSCNFHDVNCFVDQECVDSCYLYPICKRCAAENFMENNSFKKSNKSKCWLDELVALVTAELYARRIAKDPKKFGSDTKLFYTIQSIKEIRQRYLAKYMAYFNHMEEPENPEKSKDN